MHEEFSIRKAASEEEKKTNENTPKKNTQLFVYGLHLEGGGDIIVNITIQIIYAIQLDHPHRNRTLSRND